MTFLICWFVFPFVLLGLATGCGLLVERAAGLRLPGPLVPAVGFALMTVVGQLTTRADATAELTAPLLLSLGIAGVLLSWPLRDRRPDGWAAAACGAAYLVYGAPILLSGDATFAGYLRLDDTASWLAIAERIMHEGANVSGLAPSTYEATLDFYLNSDYPVGGLVPLGVGAEFIGQDYAWVWQPYLSVMAGLLALALYAALATLEISRPARAGIAFVASQPALMVGYALWGGFKEVAAGMLVVALAVLAAEAARRRTNGRGLIPLAVVSSGILAVLSSGGSVWVAPFIAPVAIVWLRASRRIAVGQVARLGAMIAVLSVPAILAAGFLSAPAASTITQEDRLANLIEPLSLLQVFGIWPAGDFRLRPDDLAPTHILIGVAGLAALLGVRWLWQRRAWELLLYCGGAAVACIGIVFFGSHWVDAKALAIASPAVMLAAFAGVVFVHRQGRRTEALMLATAIVGGIVWSNAFAYHAVNLAPRERLVELEEIGEEFAGRGPTLMTEYEPYGARYFLRDADPESAGELRRRQVRLRDGSTLPKGGFANLDQFALDEILVYRTLVLRRSPSESRPPAVYRLAWQGEHYEVWERSEPPGELVQQHLPLGSELQPSATAPCDLVGQTAELARGGGEVATVARPTISVIDLTRAERPTSWEADDRRIGGVRPDQEGTARTTFAVPRAGEYEVWLGGAVRGEVTLAIDGRPAGTLRHLLSNYGGYTPAATLSLESGSHALELAYDDSVLRPGSGGRPASLGPVAVSPSGVNREPTVVAPENAERLCGKSLDWIELLGDEG